MTKLKVLCWRVLVAAWFCAACKTEVSLDGDGGGEGEAEGEGDPCAEISCVLPAVCEIQDGKPKCLCPAGFDDVDGDGSSCIDIDECEEGTAGCVPYETCVNQPGSFACVAPAVENGHPFVLLAGQSDRDLIDAFNLSAAPVSPGDEDFEPVPDDNSGVIVVGDHVALGINALGDLCTYVIDTPLALGWGDSGGPSEVVVPVMDGGYPNDSLGFAFRSDASAAFEQDVLTPGARWDGWGVRFSVGDGNYSGGSTADEASLPDAELLEFSTAYDATDDVHFVRSRATVGPLRVTMDYSLRRTDFYVSERIVLENTGKGVITELRFARAADFDVGPGHYTGDSYDFLYPAGLPQLVRVHDLDDPGDISDDLLGKNDNFYGVGTTQPDIACIDGSTAFSYDPDVILESVGCDDDPEGTMGDFAVRLVFEPADLPSGASSEL